MRATPAHPLPGTGRGRVVKFDSWRALAGGAAFDGGLLLDQTPIRPDAESKSLRLVVLDRIHALLDLLQELEPESGCLNKPSIDSAMLRAAARRMLEARARRDMYIPSEVLGEPCWDMLLALFAASGPISNKAVCHSSGAPQTTAWRWLSYLEQRGLVEKSLDQVDTRRRSVRLSSTGEAAMHSALMRMTTHMNGGLANTAAWLGLKSDG
jgi:hypothetical protein